MAGADTLNLTGLPTFTYNGGVYVGAASGDLNGVTSLKLICNDFVDTTYIPSSFVVNVSTIPSLTYGMYAQPRPPTAGQLAAYEMASLLLWQMGLPANQTADGIGGLNYAIWNLFNPSVPDPGTSASWVSWAQSQNLADWDYSGVMVFTPSNSSNQEFMSGAAAPVPEPGTSVMFLLGGVALVTVGRWRLKKE